jgi:hypothetical protein
MHVNEDGFLIEIIDPERGRCSRMANAAAFISPPCSVTVRR